MNRFQVLRNLQKQPQESVLEKKMFFLARWWWCFLNVSCYEQLKIQGSESCRNSIIILKRHVNLQAFTVIFPTSIKGTWTEAYLEPSRTSTMEFFCENSWRLKPVNYFRKRGQSYVLHLVLKYTSVECPSIAEILTTEISQEWQFKIVDFPRSVLKIAVQEHKDFWSIICNERRPHLRSYN